MSKILYVILVPGTWETQASNSLREPEGLLKQVVDQLPGAYNGYRIYCRSIGYLARFGGEAAAVDSVKDGETKLQHAIAALPPGAAFALVGYSQGAWIAGNIAQEIGLGTLPLDGKKFIGYFGLSDPRRDGRDRVGGPIAGEGILGGRGSWGTVEDRVHQFAIRGDLIATTVKTDSLLPELAPYLIKFWVGRPDQWVAYALGKYHADRGLYDDIRKKFPGIRGFFEFRRRADLTGQAVAFYLRTGVHGHYVNYEIKPGVTVPRYIANTIKEELELIEG
ncbi:lysin B [Gordonia phage ASerpRocky]|uniref:Lysin B n=1 Tax=Gordonia phage ASerpRocky TaxID=2599841 RepID=A0A5J6TC90_9CAUD|nr:lysin B [Gordonia phage ASerpRocky]